MKLSAVTVEESNLWASPLETLMLGSDEVHVWRASLDLKASQFQSLQHTLSADEHARARRFHFEKDRECFIVARGLLRVILGRYLDMEAAHLCFCYGPHGKPELAEKPGEKALRFNMSHSQGLALYAVTRGRKIGIDLECIRPIPEVEEIAERFFSVRENALFRALPAHEKLEAFFNCWTRKEALSKALGDGLARTLDQFDVSLAPGEPAKLLNLDGVPQEVSHWSLRELTPASGYVAAIAVEGHDWRLTCWRWADGSVRNAKLGFD